MSANNPKPKDIREAASKIQKVGVEALFKLGIQASVSIAVAPSDKEGDVELIVGTIGSPIILAHILHSTLKELLANNPAIHEDFKKIIMTDMAMHQAQSS